MAGLKDAVGKKMTKDVKFMGLDVTISKLSVGQVQELQSLSAGADEQRGQARGHPPAYHSFECCRGCGHL